MTKIRIGNGQLNYTKNQGGKNVLLAFHGFGQDKDIFEDWIEILSKDFTIYTFDLFYHGLSTRPYEKLSKQEWTEYLKAFLETEKIKTYSILGFSLGGRFAISSALAFPDRTDELILIAPDGIYLSIWFKLITNPLSRWLLKYLMISPGKLEKLIVLNEKYRLVSPYIGDFVRKEMGDNENRKRVYISWNYFKSLGYSKKQLKRTFNQYTFKRQLILGSKDQVIKPHQILPMIEKMGHFKVTTLPLKHHQLVKVEVAEVIAESKSEK